MYSSGVYTTATIIRLSVVSMTIYALKNLTVSLFFVICLHFMVTNAYLVEIKFLSPWSYMLLMRKLLNHNKGNMSLNDVTLANVCLYNIIYIHTGRIQRIKCQ